jgi:hypothetical protein
MPYVLIVVKQDRTDAKLDSLQTSLKTATEASSVASQAISNGLAIVLSGVLEINRSSITSIVQQAGFSIIEGPTVSRDAPKLESGKVYTVTCTVRPYLKASGVTDLLKRETGAVEVNEGLPALKNTMIFVLVGVTDLAKASESNLAKLFARFGLTFYESPEVLEGIHPKGYKSPFKDENIKRIMEQIQRRAGGSFHY